ncbi:unnamed protein product, partial [Staurois parvus]
MITVAPAVPPVSVHQCLINTTYQCPSALPFSATYQWQSVLPISAAYQCHILYECCLSVPISDACQCPSVPPTSASSSVPISATYQ